MSHDMILYYYLGYEIHASSYNDLLSLPITSLEKKYGYAQKVEDEDYTEQHQLKKLHRI